MFGNPFNALDNLWDDAKDSLSSKNNKDPIPRIGKLLSPEAHLVERFGGGKLNDVLSGEKVADNVNFQVDRYLQNAADDLKIKRPDSGFLGWIGNKPATFTGALVTGGAFAGNAFGNNGGGSVPADPELDPVKLGANTVKVGNGGGFNWQKALQMGGIPGLGGGQQQGGYSQPTGYTPPSQGDPNFAALLAQPQQQEPPKPTSWSEKLMSNMSTPQAQFALRMLANNQDGRSFGNVLGMSGLQQQEAQAQSQQAQLQQQLLRAQIAKAQQPGATADTIGVISPDKYTPSSVAKFKKSNDYSDLVLADTRSSQSAQMAAYGEYVKQSVSAGKEPMSIEQFLPMYTDWTTRMTPSVQNVADVPTMVTPQRGGGANQVPLTTLPAVAAGANTVAQATAAGSTAGQARAEAAADLPRKEMNAQQAMDTVDGLLAADGAPRIFGLQGSLPYIPGSKRADAKTYLQQIEGKAFLEAFNSLRGGGAITKEEGEKATAAIARLNKAQSWESAQKALKDLKKVIEAGLKNSRQKAGQSSDGSKVIDYEDL